jgi:aryl-alcohol dehydrogenase-like predicted oxidoreductase
MRYRNLGGTGMQVSAICLGAMAFGAGNEDPDDCARIVHLALDSGVNFIDTADRYSNSRSEEILGKALAGRRDEVILASKFGMVSGDKVEGGASAPYVKKALDASLTRLGTDRIDLYQLHRPDPATPIADTLAALAELVKAGKVREIGCSNFSAAQLREADVAAAGGAPRFVSVQNQYSLLEREPELEVLAECERLGTAFIPYSPLANGLLSGKYRRGEPPPPGTRLAGMPTDRRQTLLAGPTMDVVEELEDFARQHGHSLLDLAIAWLAAKAVVASVIAGATKAEQVHANVNASDWVLTEEELQAVDRIAPGPTLAG